MDWVSGMPEDTVAVEVVPLRDGSTANDSRLGRLVEFDDRSRDYPAIPRASAIHDYPLRSYSWRCSQFLDQGREGSCCGHMAAHELIARPNEVKGVTQPDAVRLYRLAQQRDEWDGEAYEGSSNLGVSKAVMELYAGEVTSYSWCFGILDVLRVLGYRSPVGLGALWRRGMSLPDEKGFIHNTGVIDGGHSVLCRGVKLVFMDRKVAKTWQHLNTDESYVKIHQSWGGDFGDGGMVYLSVGELSTLLQEDGDAVRFERTGG